MNMGTDNYEEARIIMMTVHAMIDQYINAHGTANGCTVFVTESLAMFIASYADPFRTFVNAPNISCVFGVPIKVVACDGRKFWIGEEFEV